MSEVKLNSLPDIIRNLLPLVGVRLPFGFGVGHGETIRKEAMDDMTVVVEVLDHLVMELIDRAEDVVVTNVERDTLYAPYDQNPHRRHPQNSRYACETPSCSPYERVRGREWTDGEEGEWAV